MSRGKECRRDFNPPATGSIFEIDCRIRNASRCDPVTLTEIWTVDSCSSKTIPVEVFSGVDNNPANFSMDLRKRQWRRERDIRGAYSSLVGIIIASSATKVLFLSSSARQDESSYAREREGE